jgi:hypothetical protein
VRTKSLDYMGGQTARRELVLLNTVVLTDIAPASRQSSNFLKQPFFCRFRQFD